MTPTPGFAVIINGQKISRFRAFSFGGCILHINLNLLMDIIHINFGDFPLLAKVQQMFKKVRYITHNIFLEKYDLIHLPTKFPVDPLFVTSSSQCGSCLHELSLWNESVERGDIDIDKTLLVVTEKFENRLTFNSHIFNLTN